MRKNQIKLLKWNKRTNIRGENKKENSLCENYFSTGKRVKKWERVRGSEEGEEGEEEKDV